MHFAHHFAAIMLTLTFITSVAADARHISRRQSAPSIVRTVSHKIINRASISALSPSKLAGKARAVAKKTRTFGWCFAAVKSALRPFGIVLRGSAAYMAKSQLSSDSRFEQVSLTDLKPGDILVHERSEKHPYGHIAVYLGNKEEASDHVQTLITGETYGGTSVFRLKSPVMSSVTQEVTEMFRPDLHELMNERGLVIA